MKTRAAISSVLLLALAPCEAQVKIQVQGGKVILNGGQVINAGEAINLHRLVIGGESDEEIGEGGGASPDAGDTAQVLEFADGSRLHGTLEKLDGVKKEIVWRGVDASAPLTFPLGHVSRWGAPSKTKAEVKARATVKLTGGDWMAADVTGLTKDKLNLMLGDGTPVAVDRARVEWIYFSKTAAAECYDGPTGISGWVSDGSWTYREGALRAARPTTIGRLFEALPDQVEYRFDYEPGAGGTRAFAVLLHGADPVARGFGPGMVRLMINDSQFNLWAQRQDHMKQEGIDLTKILGAPAAGGAPAKRKPLRWRIFEDRPAGRLVVFIDGRKVGDFRDIGKIKAGENRGCVSFQPMAWNAEGEQGVAKIKVLPWDGFVPVEDALENARPKTDQAVLADGDREAGRIESISADKVQIGGTSVPRSNVAMLRFARPETALDEDPPLGRVRLAHRGEFEVTSLGFQEGKLRVGTHFGGELMLAAASVRGLEFSHLAPIVGKPVDLVLFRNGDQLRGLLGASSSGQKLRWQTGPNAAPVELDLTRLAGVQLAPRGQRPEGKTGVLARCRNGDLLAGNLVAMDKEQVALDSGAAGRLTIPRDRVQALYFSHEGKLPVADGAAEHELWEKGLSLNPNRMPAANQAKPAPPPPSRWSYFDGVFGVKRTVSRGRDYNDGSVNLGRMIEGMPARVEFSFEVAGKVNQVFVSAQLFSEPNNPGYVLQLHPGGLYIYDTGAHQRRAGQQQQVQVQFGDKVKADATRHRVRILADRPSGRMTVLINDTQVASFGPKAGAAPRNLGTGLALMPQQNMTCTFSNLWVAPWNGQLPGTGPAPAAAADSVLLANGDETQGTVGKGTPEMVQIESEVGPLDVPVSRLTMVEFGQRAAEKPEGVRLRLTDRSVITVSAYRIENDVLIGQSAVLGEIKVPLAAVQEIVFGRVALPKGEEKGPSPVRGGAGGIIRG
jgi:hypothetical protein